MNGSSWLFTLKHGVEPEISENDNSCSKIESFMD